MKKFYDLEQTLIEGLNDFDSVKNRKLKMGEIEALDKLLHSIKSIICIIEKKEDEMYESERSHGGMWEARINGGYGDRNTYDYDNSTRRGRSMRRGMSRDDAKYEMIEQLEDMMYNTEDVRAKEMIKKTVDDLKRMQ